MRITQVRQFPEEPSKVNLQGHPLYCSPWIEEHMELVFYSYQNVRRKEQGSLHIKVGCFVDTKG